jgi:alpha-mannosidase
VTTQVAGLPIVKSDEWTMNLFIKADAKPEKRLIVAGFGKPEDKDGAGAAARYFAIKPEDGIEFWHGGRNLKTNSPLDLGRWQMLTATYNGDSLTLYKDGEKIGQERVGFRQDADSCISVGAPDPWEHAVSFQGKIQNFTIRRGALDEKEVQALLQENKPQ